MKSQKHNQGELRELKVRIEKDVLDDIEIMVQNSHLTLEDIVVIALKRFRSSHTDYLKQTPRAD